MNEVVVEFVGYPLKEVVGRLTQEVSESPCEFVPAPSVESEDGVDDDTADDVKSHIDGKDDGDGVHSACRLLFVYIYCKGYAILTLSDEKS